MHCFSVLLCTLLLANTAKHTYAKTTTTSLSRPLRAEVVDVEPSEHLYTLPWNLTFDDEYFRSITGLTYVGNDRFYAISEDDDNPSKIFTVRFTLSSQPTIVDVTNLTDTTGSVNEDLGSPQAIHQKGNDLYIAHDDEIISRYYANTARRRNNINYAANVPPLEAGEGLTSLSFDRYRDNILWTASKLGASNDNERYIRLMAININDRSLETQYVYRVDNGYGVVAINSIDDDGSFLILERTDGDARLYYVASNNALNVDAYGGDLDTNDIDHFMAKQRLATFSALSTFGTTIPVGNFDAMALRSLTNNRAKLVFISCSILSRRRSNLAIVISKFSFFSSNSFKPFLTKELIL